MNFRLFRRRGPFAVPSSLAGGGLAILTILVLVWRFLEIDSRSHSASDTLINFFFNALIVGAMYSIIGFLTSGRRQE